MLLQLTNASITCTNWCFQERRKASNLCSKTWEWGVITSSDHSWRYDNHASVLASSYLHSRTLTDKSLTIATHSERNLDPSKTLKFWSDGNDFQQHRYETQVCTRIKERMDWAQLLNHSLVHTMIEDKGQRRTYALNSHRHCERKTPSVDGICWCRSICMWATGWQPMSRLDACPRKACNWNRNLINWSANRAYSLADEQSGSYIVS